MTTPRSFLQLLFILALSVPPAFAQFGPIDFEGYPSGTPVDQLYYQPPTYFTFQNATILSTLDGGLSSLYPPNSGYGVAYDSGSPITMGFNPVPGLGLIGVYFTTRDNFHMLAYDMQGNMIAEYDYLGCNYLGCSGDQPNIFGHVSINPWNAWHDPFASVVMFSDDPSGNSFTIDDMNFGIYLGPEPASMLMMGSGVALVVGRLRKRR